MESISCYRKPTWAGIESSVIPGCIAALVCVSPLYQVSKLAIGEARFRERLLQPR
jgi:hypothetical protein